MKNENKPISLSEFEKIILDIQNNDLKENEVPELLKKYYNEMKNIQDKPVEPEPEECCGSGCRPCVYDLYDTNLQEYLKEVKDLYALIIKDNKSVFIN